ncbi:DUF3251 domain-containing protein [Entomohabitans teleogrylli]|uniref:DUF3251 domain-containing protein n=1 Tax=Entomohabitans teleogrylli TaxID=1384589 RepID=UPI00073D8DA0|nr:DUF3251 domain-containing protein [Entomohabitans teleogrylli]
MRPVTYLKITLPALWLLLTACAQQPPVSQVSHEIRALDQQMTRLSEQSIKLGQQNTLNAHSTVGAWLLPGANGPALLDSQIGTLRLALSQVVAGENGSQTTLTIHGPDNQPLPAFSAEVEWGELQGTLEHYQEVNVQRQIIQLPASLRVPSEIAVPLRLEGISPQRLGFVRLHDVQPVN